MKNEFVLIPKEDYLTLQNKMDMVLELLKNKDPNKVDKVIDGKWIPEVIVKEMLGRETSVLWRMRRDGLLTYSKFNNTVYYDRQSIVDLFEKNQHIRGEAEG